jgi:hypothetical protein
MKTTRWVSAACLAMASSAFGGVTMNNQGAPGAAWPASPDGTLAPTIQTGLPSTGTVAQTVAPNVVEGHAFTVTSPGFKVGALAWTFSGSAAGNYGIHLFPFQGSSVYTPSAGGYVPASDLSADLLTGGASVAYSGSGSSNVIFFDLTGADEVTLAPGIYAFEVWNLGTNTGSIFPMRAGETYAGGSIYQTGVDPAALSGSSSVGRNNVAGGTRDGIFAVYAANVPEPTTLLSLAPVAVAALRRRVQ